MSSRGRWRSWEQLASDLNRLNYILIPTSTEERERWRSSRTVRAFRWLLFAAGRFTEDGQLLLAFTVAAGLVAVDVTRSDIYLAWASMGSLLFASWAHSYLFRLKGVRVDVSTPRRITVGEEATFTLSARNEGGRDYETLLARGAFLPWDGSWILRRAETSRLPRHGVSRVELRARFAARGDHRLDPFRLQALVPFGLALGPALESDEIRLLAVPQVANVIALSLPQGRQHHPGGRPLASRTADSRELLGLRPYRFGDPVRDLHAGTWARIGAPVVREYREEYFSRVGIVLDTDVGHDPGEAFEAAISLVAGIIDRLSRTETLVDLIVIGRPSVLTLGRGLGSLDRALEFLARVEAGRSFERSAVTAQVLPLLSSVSSVLFVALRWDEARRAFAHEVDDAGRRCTSFVLQEAFADDAALPGATRISPALIRGHREIAL